MEVHLVCISIINLDWWNAGNFKIIRLSHQLFDKTYIIMITGKEKGNYFNSIVET